MGRASLRSKVTAPPSHTQTCPSRLPDLDQDSRTTFDLPRPPTGSVVLDHVQPCDMSTSHRQGALKSQTGRSRKHRPQDCNLITPRHPSSRANHTAPSEGSRSRLTSAPPVTPPCSSAPPAASDSAPERLRPWLQPPLPHTPHTRHTNTPYMPHTQTCHTHATHHTRTNMPCNTHANTTQANTKHTHKHKTRKKHTKQKTLNTCNHTTNMQHTNTQKT